MTDRRQYASATERNREPILEVLQRVLPPMGTILEIASGSGQHAVYFAPRLAPRVWLPSEPTEQGLASIRDWMAVEPAANLCQPLALNVCMERWLVEDDRWVAGLGSLEVPAIAAIVAINMIHIAPWEACLGLLAGANRILPRGGVLYLYGPYKRGDRHTAASNESFEGWLRSQNPAWGVRNLETVVAAAALENLVLQEVVEMPANNLSVVFEK